MCHDTEALIWSTSFVPILSSQVMLSTVTLLLVPMARPVACLRIKSVMCMLRLPSPWWLRIYFPARMALFVLLFTVPNRSMSAWTPKQDSNVGSLQVSFLTCTLEIPQKLQYKFYALSF